MSISKTNTTKKVTTTEIVSSEKRLHRNPDLTLTTDQTDHLTTLTSKSSKIRFLLSFNLPQSSIARYLNVKDQFVSNIKRSPLKKVTK